MTITQPLSLFISSKMAELAEERQAVQHDLKSYHMFGWLFEKDAGARPESIQETYLEEVARCDIYIGLFWQGYGIPPLHPPVSSLYERSRRCLRQAHRVFRLDRMRAC